MAGPATLITGIAEYSLGEAFIIEYCSRQDRLPIIALDLHRNLRIGRFDKLDNCKIDLNPLSCPGGYLLFGNQLSKILQDSAKKLSCDVIHAAILSAGLYSSGPLIEETAASRKDILGVNVCGKYELLHAALSMNNAAGFDNGKGFTLIDIGSSHGLYPSNGYSLYAPSKAYGLDLCVTLQDGNEIRRCIHLAPGPIDTCMLHRNYWVTKEKGPKMFYENLLSQNKKLYYDVFVGCSENALVEACKQDGEKVDNLIGIFNRYKTRREEKIKTEEGIIQPKDLAALLANILMDANAFKPGVYVITAPQGRLQIKQHGFPAFRSR